MVYYSILSYIIVYRSGKALTWPYESRKHASATVREYLKPENLNRVRPGEVVNAAARVDCELHSLLRLGLGSSIKRPS